MPAKPVQHDGIKLSDVDRERTSKYAKKIAEDLKDVSIEAGAGADVERATYKIKPLYLSDANERVVCVEHIWSLIKDAPPGMAKFVRTVEISGFHFDSETGMMVRPDMLSVYYKLHETHKRQYELYQYDLVVLWAISNRGAKNFFQVESELATRIRHGVITTVVRNELYDSLVRIQKARLWTIGELPRTHGGKGAEHAVFQPQEVSASRNY